MFTARTRFLLVLILVATVGAVQFMRGKAEGRHEAGAVYARLLALDSYFAWRSQDEPRSQYLADFRPYLFLSLEESIEFQLAAADEAADLIRRCVGKWGRFGPCGPWRDIQIHGNTIYNDPGDAGSHAIIIGRPIPGGLKIRDLEIEDDDLERERRPE